MCSFGLSYGELKEPTWAKQLGEFSWLRTVAFKSLLTVYKKN